MMKILIVKMSALGDVVMALPALLSLRKKYPDAQIDWLVEPPAKSLLESHPAINRVIISPRRECLNLCKSIQPIKALKMYSCFIKELRAVNYDIAIDLQGLLKSAFMIFRARATLKTGFESSREYTAWALNNKMPAFDIERHAARRYLDAAVFLGADYPDPEPLKYYDPPQEARQKASAMMDSSRKYIVLNPGAKWQSKQWPLKHWQSLAALLKNDAKLLISGGLEDRVWGEEIKKAADGQPQNLCGETSLPLLAAIMERSALVITCDTGPMHLAAAVGSKGLAIFGPTLEQRTGPFGGDFEIIKAPHACRGCLKRNCPGGKNCLEAVSPDFVYQKALTRISNLY